MRARLAAPPVRLMASRAVGLVAVLLALGAALVLAGVVARATGGATAATTPYAQQVGAIQQRYTASLSELNALLRARDTNPTLVESSSWQQQFAKVKDDLAAEYAELRAIQPPPGSAQNKECLENAYRLTADGATLLAQGFQIDGHGAYYFGSHGNWDLNLGQQQLRRCGAQ